MLFHNPLQPDPISLARSHARRVAAANRKSRSWQSCCPTLKELDASLEACGVLPSGPHQHSQWANITPNERSLWLGVRASREKGECAACSKRGGKLCLCKTVRYCSKDCQKAHRAEHKPICEGLIKMESTRSSETSACPQCRSRWTDCRCTEKPRYVRAPAPAHTRPPVRTRGHRCWICLESTGDLVKSCACPGVSGFVHSLCIAEINDRGYQDNMPLFALELSEFTCPLCKHSFAGSNLQQNITDAIASRRHHLAIASPQSVGDAAERTTYLPSFAESAADSSALTSSNVKRELSRLGHAINALCWPFHTIKFSAAEFGVLKTVTAQVDTPFAQPWQTLFRQALLACHP